MEGRRPVFISSWSNKDTPWRERLERAGWDRKTEQDVLIIDEGQDSFWDAQFYIEFIKYIEGSSWVRAVIFTAYGSSDNQNTLGVRLNWRNTPLYIPPQQRLSLRPVEHPD